MRIQQICREWQRPSWFSNGKLVIITIHRLQYKCLAIQPIGCYPEETEGEQQTNIERGNFLLDKSVQM